MRKILTIVGILCMSVAAWAQDADCSSYLPEIAPTGACADQSYLLQIPLNQCPGTINICFVITSDLFASELDVALLDANGNEVVSLINPGDFPDVAGDLPEICTGDVDATLGPFTLEVLDDFGDGNTGSIVITDPNNGGNALYSLPFSTDLVNLGLYDLAPAAINPITTITIDWYENGALIQTDANVACNNLFRQYILTSTAICQAEAQSVGYEVTCDLDGSTLASNLNIPVMVYPPVAPLVTDLVTISYTSDPAGGCAAPTITYLNDCTAAEVLVVENTAPAACNTGDTNTAGNGDFTVTYVGPAGSPDCCATGGPQVPLNDMGGIGDVVGTLGPSDQFGGVNNAAGFTYSATIPGCGIATSGILTYNVCNIVHPTAVIPLPPPTGQDPGASGEENYFVTIYVNGVIVFDGDLETGGTFGDFTLCADNTIDLTASAFDGNAVVDVYVYGNSTSPGPGEYPTDWTADIAVSVDVTYDICTEAAPLDCEFPVVVPYDCPCPPAPVCTLTDAGYVVGACNDSGTDMDPADDTFTFDLNPTGTDLGASGYTFTDGANYTGSGTYGASATFGPFMIADGAQTITITDVDNPGCTIDVMVMPPNTCSDVMPPMCTLSSAGLSASACDNAGTTAEDNSADADDTFVLTIDPVGMNTGTTYTIAGDATGTGSYGTAFTVTLPADGAAISIIITDDMDNTCTITEGIMAPASCSMEAVNEIPTVGEWGLIILTLLLSITAIVGIRQRNVEEMTT